MKLKEYIETVFYPKLSYHVQYSDFFEKQFEKFENRIVGVTYKDKPICFYCWKEEEEEFKKLLKEDKLTYNKELIGKNGSFEFLIEYSKYFEKGFESIDYNTPANVLINKIPFCSTFECINPNHEHNSVIALGRKVANSKPCIAGRRPFTFDTLFGEGLLRANRINNDTQERVLANPQKVAFNEGVMFKSIFLVIERYTEFDNYFNGEDKCGLSFIDTLIEGIKEIQIQDEKCEGIRIIKNGEGQREEPFRDWFKTYLKGKYNSVNAESVKGSGRIDLRIEDINIGTKILEFKGWWNKDKNMLPVQIMNYLTDFEQEGYIVMINNCKTKSIEHEYINLIKSEGNGYKDDSLVEQVFPNSNYRYFVTKHSDNIRIKTLYHFIINVY